MKKSTTDQNNIITENYFRKYLKEILERNTNKKLLSNSCLFSFYTLNCQREFFFGYHEEGGLQFIFFKGGAGRKRWETTDCELHADVFQ